jgi:uncharacterized protein (UPF0332 family)
MEKGLLRRVPPSPQNARSSLEAARRWLEEASKNLETEAFNSSVLSSYLAMFHSARAILYLDGFREKSHFCVARYIEEKYVRTEELERRWIDLFDHFRTLRHEGQYSTGFFSTNSEAQEALASAKEFVERMESLVQERL